MSTPDNGWFEIFYDQSDDVLPNWLLIVIPDSNDPNLMLVYDPFEKRIVHSGDNYQNTRIWLAEDEFQLVSGRMFRDEYFGHHGGKQDPSPSSNA